MSLTSCFRYIIELPVGTLNAMIAAVVQEADAAGVQTSVHKTGVAMGAYTATVDAQLDPANPPVMDLTPVDLGLIMHLKMKLQVKVNEIANLDPIQYQLAFDFPGVFQKVTPATTPPVLNIVFPGLAGAALNLNVTGGQVALTPALIEPQVHALYQAHPELAHNVKTGVATGLPSPEDTWAVIVDIFDDAPGSMPFRGQITVDAVDATHIKINFPGHLKAQSISDVPIDSDIKVHVTIKVIQSDGKIVVALSQVVAADVAIDWTSPNLYTVGGGPVIQAQFATRIAALGHPDDPTQTTPTQAQIRDAITQALVEYGAGLTIPMLRPTPPASPGDMDLTTFQPTTLGGQLLALEIEPQPVPCDTPDAFANASQFAVSVDKEKCDSTIQPVVAAENGKSRNIQGHDVDIHDLSASLADPGENGVANGHIWIAGQATVHIDCWPDAHINFSGPITLTPDKQTDGTYRFKPIAGKFSADDPCCASADPNQIADLIQGDDYPPFGGLPSNFAGVGTIDIELTSVDIFKLGIVLRGTLAVTTTHSLKAGVIQHNTYWGSEPPGGG
ncbi:MAG: hypothetical protein M3Y07_04105 [Acidobacteriota bacterium]|nr:hypothetical protein [Acidobacteriota bacterium]